MVDGLAWNEDNQLLAAIVDGRLTVWYFPAVVMVDRELRDQTRVVLAAPASTSTISSDNSNGTGGGTVNSFRQGSIAGFYGVQCLVRRSDGAIINVPGISAYPVVLMEVVRKKQWEEAVKLCRFIKVKNICTQSILLKSANMNVLQWKVP
jgi:intraflagellar transport protein 80